MKVIQRKTFAVGLAAIAAVGFSACSSNKSESAQQTSASPATSMAAPASTSAMTPATNLIGSGCADYAAQHPSGPASVTGM
ncbi:MAG: fasciclin domain-containing protein, partial [Mycobacterium sp.]